ncbi:hypothetical protein STEG23_001016 [Scotinomys teguina]
MVKVGVNECGLIGFLVTKNVTASGKVKVIAIEDPFIDLNNMVYMFQYDCIYVSSCQEKPRRALDTLELELQVTVSHPVWVL